MASTYLSRTPSGDGNRKTMTFSFWFKRSSLGSTERIFSTWSNSASNQFWIRWNSDALMIFSYTGAVTTLNLTTSQLFRDVSAWYHIVVAVDTTQATSSDRIKIYLNGSQITSFSTSTYPTQNLDTEWNRSSAPNIIGGEPTGGNGEYISGSMAHVHFIDGTTYDASTFGETDAASGIWKPKTNPSVTYGNNGFFLKFANSGSLGTDSSGNGNNFTVNGTGTQTLDTPSNVFATLNTLCKGSNITLSNGNLTYVTSDAWESAPSTLAFSKGKWYAEYKPTSVLGAGNSFIMFGIDSTALTSTWLNQYPGHTSEGYAYGWDGGKRNSGNNTSYGDSFSQNDIISVAVDMDNNFIYFAKNGVWQNSGVPTSGATGTGGLALTGTEYYFIGSGYNNGVNATFNVNFGNGYFGTTAVASGNADGAGYGIFEYAPPTGYYALCTKNINTYG